MNKPTIFLQNAWSKEYAGRHWPRESWLKALERSRSGKMLANLTNDLTTVHNTTLEVSQKASQACNINYMHMVDVLDETRPRVVVACGLQAIEAVRVLWQGPRLELPHPACRWVSTDIYKEGRRLLDLMTIAEMDFRARVWQKKAGPVTVEILRTKEVL